MEILLTRSSTGLESGLQDGKIAAILVELEPGADEAALRNAVMSWGDANILSNAEQRDLFLNQRLWKLKLQILSFTSVLMVVMAVVNSLIVYTMTSEKLHQISLLKLIGARNALIIDQPTLGEVRFGADLMSHPDVDLDHLRDFRRQSIGCVFQKPNLIPFLTAAENVALAMEIDDVAPDDARAHAEAIPAALDLGHRVDTLPSCLSGGEQQRVSIARALANGPKLILADEPTAALDSVRGRQAISLFRRIANERGTAVAVVTHDARSLDLFDRVIEFKDGRIVREHRGGATLL